MNKARAEILDLDKQWARAAAEGNNTDLIVSFWADDAMLLPPAMPAIIGKDAIRQFVEQSLAMPGFSITWETTDVTLSEDATLAYAVARNKTTFNGPQGKQITVYGKAITVWRKEPSGTWKCVIDIWNEDPQTS
jgi:ketosteroid isomerase-like protein